MRAFGQHFLGGTRKRLVQAAGVAFLLGTIAVPALAQDAPPDRMVAEWMLRMGGSVVLEGQHSAIGFNTMILPYQVPPVVVGMQAAGISIATTLKATLPLAAIGIVIFLPLEYLWWRWIGYFG